ncbi:MAG: RNA polymerase sigma factor [candidate division Zixibacteria bacterium]|nr:RNA polymerase sigma factor [candidate division Zixibacteria bacterium]
MAPGDQLESTQNGRVSDKELMEKVKSDDTSAFGILVDRYKVRLFNLIYRLLHNKEEAEDILQETFLRVYRERESYDSAYAFSTWVYTITLNLCRNELKRRKKFKFFGIDLIKNNREYASRGVKNDNHLSSTLENAISSLPVKYRTAFLLRDVNQLSYEEISQSVGIPLGTVKSRVNRARLMLRDRLKPKIREYYELSKSSQVPIQLF